MYKRCPGYHEKSNTTVLTSLDSQIWNIFLPCPKHTLYWYQELITCIRHHKCITIKRIAWDCIWKFGMQSFLHEEGNDGTLFWSLQFDFTHWLIWQPECALIGIVSCHSKLSRRSLHTQSAPGTHRSRHHNSKIQTETTLQIAGGLLPEWS